METKNIMKSACTTLFVVVTLILSAGELRGMDDGLSKDGIYGLRWGMDISECTRPVLRDEKTSHIIVLPKWKSVNDTPEKFTANIYDLLSNNLSLSGLFRVIDKSHLPPSLQNWEGIPSSIYMHEWVQTGGEILLVGEALLEQARVVVKFHLFDLMEQKHLLGKQYEGYPDNVQAIVQRMIDAVKISLGLKAMQEFTLIQESKDLAVYSRKGEGTQYFFYKGKFGSVRMVFAGGAIINNVLASLAAKYGPGIHRGGGIGYTRLEWIVGDVSIRFEGGQSMAQLFYLYMPITGKIKVDSPGR